MATDPERFVIDPMSDDHVAPEFVERKNGSLFVVFHGLLAGKLLAAKTVFPSADTATTNLEFVIGGVVGTQVTPELVDM
jgi:hypothetical protein